MTVFETIISVIMDEIFLDDSEMEHLQELNLSEESVAEICDYLNRSDFPDSSITLMDNSTYQVIGTWDSLFQMLNEVSGEILEGTVHDALFEVDTKGEGSKRTWMISHVDLTNANKYDPEVMWKLRHSISPEIDLDIPKQPDTANHTSIFINSNSKNGVSLSDIRNKAYSTLAAEDAIRNKLESVAILDPEFDHFILGNLYQIREDMINLIALTYDIKLDGLKVHSLIALLNKHLKEHPEARAISDELHEAILALPDE